MGLAWWNAAKYEWKRSARGNQYLAPQATYVTDVLHRSEHHTDRITANLSKDDYAEFDAKVESVKADIQLDDAFDGSGVEGHALRRYYLNRLVIARKICGTTAMSAEHRTRNELSRQDGNVERMQGDTSSTGYYHADVEKRESWGQKAVRLMYIVKAIADGEIITTDAAKLNELINKRVATGNKVGLGDEAYEAGRKLQSPPQAPRSDAPALSQEEIMAMCA